MSQDHAQGPQRPQDGPGSVSSAKTPHAEQEPHSSQQDEHSSVSAANNTNSSHNQSSSQQAGQTQHNSSQGTQQPADQDAGDALPDDATGDSAAADDDPARPRESIHVTVKKRLEREGRWHGQIDEIRDRMMKDAKSRFPDKKQRQQWVYGELDRMYPPLDLVKTREKISHFTPVVDDEKISHSGKSDDGQIQGLSSIPEAWPELPANAPLASEVGWVQANRLRIVTERPGGATVVELARALSPAPSWSALGWLETSIRSYAKFVDVAAKATASADDEGAVMRRERMAIEEMEALLAEMNEADGGGEA